MQMKLPPTLQEMETDSESMSSWNTEYVKKTWKDVPIIYRRITSDPKT